MITFCFLQLILTNISSFITREDTGGISGIPFFTKTFTPFPRPAKQYQEAPILSVVPVGVSPWGSIRPAPLPPPGIILSPEPHLRGGQGGQELVRPVVSHGGQVSAGLSLTPLPGLGPGQALCKLLVTLTSCLKFCPARVTTLIRAVSILHAFFKYIFLSSILSYCTILYLLVVVISVVVLVVVAEVLVTTCSEVLNKLLSIHKIF